MDILPSMPVDAATIYWLWRASMTAKNTPNFPYMDQLRNLESSIAAHAPEGSEDRLAEIHTNIYPTRVLQIGDEAEDAELTDMQGQKHHLLEALANGRYVLLDFWGINCGPCMASESEMKVFYEMMKDKLEIVCINQDKLSAWQKHEFSKRITSINLNDSKKSVSSRYCDHSSIPYYVLISPDKRIVWKHIGYGLGNFLGLAEAFNGPKQDNSSNLQLAIRKMELNGDCTTISFRYYTHKDYGFRIAKDSYLTANGKKYKLTAANGIKLDEDNYTQVKASESTDELLGNIYYSDFTLTFEPFDTIPTAFDFKEGDGEVLGEKNYNAYYIGWCANEDVFDSSFDNYTEPTSLKSPLDLSSVSLIEGWYLGTEGMKLNGVREITIPGSLAYGESTEICGGTNSPLKFIIMAVAQDEELTKLNKQLSEIETALYSAYSQAYSASSSATSADTSESDATTGE